MIEIKNLTVKKNDLLILDDINLTIHRNEKILITGKSGSGKSTLLKNILFFDEKTEGDIIFEDEKISYKNIDSFRQKIIYIGQKAPAFNGPVKEFLNIPFEFKSAEGRKPDKETVIKFLVKVSFDKSVLIKNFNSLSGGEQQRITIVQSLLLKKKIFLLDEITSSLDEENIRRVVDLFNDTDKTVLAVSHNSDWKYFADTIYEMKNGKLFNGK